MAGQLGVLSLLQALGKVSKRHVQSFGSISGQNFFFFIVLLGHRQLESVAFFGLLFVAVVLVPFSSDPMRVIPEERRALWPMGTRGWLAVRIGALLLNPIAWIGIALVAWTGWTGGLVAVAGGVAVQQMASFAKRWNGFSGDWLRSIPAPPGVFGAVMRLHWRGMLRTLDPYLALALASLAVAYRISGGPLDSTATRMLAVVITVILSTQTQVLLSLDGPGADRYLLMPIRGWQILLAKDAAFLVVVAVLVVPLDLFAGVFGGLVTLTTGHHISVTRYLPQTSWRFTSGVLFPWGVIQTVALFGIGNTFHAAGWPLPVLCVLAWAGSVVFYGWIWDRRRVER